MSGEPEADSHTPNVAQDAELLYESIREMKHLSAGATSASQLHAMLGHLATAGHLLPEVLTELGDKLDTSVTFDAKPPGDSARAAEAVSQCRALLEEAADLAFRAGTILGQAQRTLEDFA